MSASVVLAVEPDMKRALWDHLLPGGKGQEQAAFAYANREDGASAHIYRCIEWIPVMPDGFASRSAYHFELADEVRAAVIKRAHDLGASLVEFHSHTGPWPAAFSASDLIGFREFVPHIWWRLKGRPYLAVVVTHAGFDAFAWLKAPQAPERLSAVWVGDQVLTPTGLSHWEEDFNDG